MPPSIYSRGQFSEERTVIGKNSSPNVVSIKAIFVRLRAPSCSWRSNSFSTARPSEVDTNGNELVHSPVSKRLTIMIKTAIVADDAYTQHLTDLCARDSAKALPTLTLIVLKSFDSQDLFFCR